MWTQSSFSHYCSTSWMCEWRAADLTLLPCLSVCFGPSTGTCWSKEKTTRVYSIIFGLFALCFFLITPWYKRCSSNWNLLPEGGNNPSWEPKCFVNSIFVKYCASHTNYKNCMDWSAPEFSSVPSDLCDVHCSEVENIINIFALNLTDQFILTGTNKKYH